MTKLLQFNSRAQYSIKKGVDTLANAVRGTIGPKGRNVVLDHPLETPKILNDGVAIARGIDLEEPFANMVVQLLKEAAIKTNEMVDDGTTTATILVQAILTGGLKSMAAGANAMLLGKGLERAAGGDSDNQQTYRDKRANRPGGYYRCRLRVKLESDPARPQYIVTEPYLGYRLKDPLG